MGLLSVLNRNYVHPYSSLLGQAVLLVVALILAAGLLWLRSLAASRKTERFLVPGDAGAPAVPLDEQAAS